MEVESLKSVIMTDYDFVMSHSFVHLLSKEYKNLGDLRKRAGLSRDRRLIRYEVVRDEDSEITGVWITVKNHNYNLTMTSDPSVGLSLPIFCFSYQGKEVYYYASGVYASRFGDILRTLEIKRDELIVSLLTVQLYFEETDVKEVYKRIIGRTLHSNVLSTHYQEMVDYYTHLPLKPDNYEELLEAYVNDEDYF